MTPQPPEALDALFRLIDLLGVLGNAVLGGALARRPSRTPWASARWRSCPGSPAA